MLLLDLFARLPQMMVEPILLQLLEGKAAGLLPCRPVPSAMLPAYLPFALSPAAKDGSSVDWNFPSHQSLGRFPALDVPAAYPMVDATAAYLPPHSARSTLLSEDGRHRCASSSSWTSSSSSSSSLPPSSSSWPAEDDYFEPRPVIKSQFAASTAISKTNAGWRVLPALSDFVRNLVQASKTLPITLLAAMVYLDRLSQKLSSRAYGQPETAYRVLLTALIIATKFLHDAALRNVAWSTLVSPYFTTHDLVTMERQFLKFIDYDINLRPDQLVAIILTSSALCMLSLPLVTFQDDLVVGAAAAAASGAVDGFSVQCPPSPFVPADPGIRPSPYPAWDLRDLFPDSQLNCSHSFHSDFCALQAGCLEQQFDAFSMHEAMFEEQPAYCQQPLPSSHHGHPDGTTLPVLDGGLIRSESKLVLEANYWIPPSPDSWSFISNPDVAAAAINGPNKAAAAAFFHPADRAVAAAAVVALAGPRGGSLSPLYGGSLSRHC